MIDDRNSPQRVYQDEPRGPKGPKPPKPRQERAPGRVLQAERGPKTPNLMSAHEVFRCARCGNLLPVSVGMLDRCSKCGVDLHACIQCVSFDTSARSECTQSDKIPARVAPKDERNTCTLFTPLTTIERQTSSPASSNPATPGGSPSTSSGARKAFDDLFK